MSAIVLGVAALVAINSFNDNLSKDIDRQAKTLLGADLSATANRPIPTDVVAQLDSLPGSLATEAELFSMSLLPSVDESQFVRIKALEGDFPFYGEVVTEPAGAMQLMRADSTRALVDDGMMLQYGVEVGDSIKLGQQTFVIAGRLLTSFGSIGVGTSFAPPVYIHQSALPQTDLVQPGSLVNYTRYYKVPEDYDIDSWVQDRRQQMRRKSVRLTTVERQKENLQGAFASLNNFLNIVALVALLLACIGVASSVLIYVKSKRQQVAILRCLGMSSKETFSVYFLQTMVLGLISVLLGVLLGSVIQYVLPLLLKAVLPVEVSVTLSPSAMLIGGIVGMVMTSLFAIGPLLAIRDIGPLETLRISDDGPKTARPRWWLFVLILLTIVGFLWYQTSEIVQAIGFTAGLSIAFAVLYGVSNLVTWLTRRYLPHRASYVVRQGMANLYRPNNQTRTLVLSIGLGTAILTVLFVLQGLILNNVAGMGSGQQPNMVLYGIERGQQEELEELTDSYDMPIMQHVPVVTMDLVEWRGKTKKQWLQDTTGTVRRWAANREARVSYQEEMDDDDKLVRGEWTGTYTGGDSILISLGVSYAEGLGVDIGDELVWNVQGAIIKTYVGSLREINFRKMESRFFILFPTGVLEAAPQFMILVTKSPDKETTATYRNAVVKAMPNISIIDLGSILTTLNDIVAKVSYVVRFMASFSIMIGLLVLISSLLLSKYQRIRESVLLRTIGARRSQVFAINAVEYLTLGSVAALMGIILALLISYALAKLVFELDFIISWWPIIGIYVLIVALTVVIGMWNSREVVRASPMSILRRLG
jgi:putative ABC transport system permease protein